MRPFHRSRAAFTLVELLVVIAIIGVLVALLLPAVQTAREASRRMACGSNMRQLAVALHNYHDTYRQFPFGHLFRGVFDGLPNDGAGGSGFGWGYSILPYIEQNTLFEQFNPSQPIGSTQPAKGPGTLSNVVLAQTPLPAFACPSDNKPPNFNDGAVPNSATASYQGCGTSYDGWDGSAVTAAPNTLRFNGVFDRDNRGSVAMKSITDGLSNQFMVAETKWRTDANQRTRSRIYGASDQATHAVGASNALMINGQWPMNWTAAQGNPQPHRTAGSEHPKGAQFALADGSVRFISEQIQHTATAWISNAEAFNRPNNGARYGLYQRYFSVDDGLLMGTN